jgi:ferredoxin
MARSRDRLRENAPGDFFVDSTCIDCDLCRQLAPKVFTRDDRRGQSVVAHQPANDAERHRALMALVTCPTASIATERKLETKEAARAFPELVEGDVYFCGWASESSYGASSWLIRRPDGNVLVDSPRKSETLMKRIDELGGVRFMFLTHRDDVADHEAYRKRFGCERVIHKDDAWGEWERLIDGPVKLATDLEIVPVPGHTKGSAVLIYKNTFAFTGDHLWATDEQDGLEAGRGVCWYSWPEQRRSMHRLAEYAFTWVLPGHGRRFHAASVEAMRAEVMRLAKSM